MKVRKAEIIEKGRLKIEDISIWFVDGAFYAIYDLCPHAGCPLSEGILKGKIIECMCHGWKFDIEKGEFLLSKNIKIKKYKVLDNGEELEVIIDQIDQTTNKKNKNNK